MSEEYEILPNDCEKNFDYTFKIIVIGDCAVGKSSLTVRATRNSFNDLYTPTVGFEFFSFNIKYKEKIIKLQIWDTCGQEIYRSLICSFYRNSSLAIIVYSIDNYNSFKNIDNWLSEVKTQANPDEKIFLIGNKIDLEDKREVKISEGQQFADENNVDLFMETSAKTGENTHLLFAKAAILLYENSEKCKSYNLFPRDTISNANVKISFNNQEWNEPNRKKNCCGN